MVSGGCIGVYLAPSLTMWTTTYLCRTFFFLGNYVDHIYGSDSDDEPYQVPSIQCARLKFVFEDLVHPEGFLCLASLKLFGRSVPLNDSPRKAYQHLCNDLNSRHTEADQFLGCLDYFNAPFILRLRLEQ